MKKKFKKIMLTNKSEVPEYHFVATNIDGEINTQAKIFFAGNWCLKSNKKLSLQKNIEFVPHIWTNIETREKDYIFIEKIIDEYCEKISSFLNKFSNENFPTNFWKILILPWLTYYLPSQLYRWKIVNLALEKKKTFSFFSLPEDSLTKYSIDTISYYKLMKDNSEFNYFHFKRMLKYLKNNGKNIFFIEKQYQKKELKKNRDFFFKIIKNNFLEFIDNMSLFFSKHNKIFIEHDVFGKKNLLKINLKLKQFPTYFIKLFNHNLENIEYMKCKFDKNKRESTYFNDEVKVNENTEFMKYLNLSIKEDIPICFLEGLKNLKKRSEKININPKLILSGYKYMHSEKFKFWVALKKLKNKSRFIVALHGGGYHKKFDANFNFENKMVDKKITWVEPVEKNDIQLPVAKFINLKTKRKYKYLSYVERESSFFPSKFTDNPLTEINNLENINQINLILKKKILKNLIYLPGKSHLNSINKIKNVINASQIAKPYSLNKYLHKSKLIICSYPETTFNEAILTGPTILISGFNEYPALDKYKNIFEDLKKYKIFFSNPSEACEHINKIWDNVDDWWFSTEVKSTVKNFISSTSPTSNNAINLWGNFLKEEAS